MLRKSGWVVLAVLVPGCLGSAQPKAQTPEGLLEQAKTDAAAAHWPEARAAAVTYFAKSCKHTAGNPRDCSRAWPTARRSSPRRSS